MKTLVFAAVMSLSSSLSSGSHAADDCACSAPDQLAQTQCASFRIRRLDVELNRTYKAALAALPETSPQDERKGREQLRKSQHAWLRFKDDHCVLVGALEGGTNLAVARHVALCKENALKERMSFLRGVVDGRL